MEYYYNSFSSTSLILYLSFVLTEKMITEILTSIAIFLIVFHLSWKNTSFVKKINAIPGPKNLPIFGNSIAFFLATSKLMRRFLLKYMPKYGPITKIWFFSTPIIIINSASAAEVILKNGTKHINKSDTYRFMKEWLGFGMITASGQRWKAYRKTLTPAFYFNNLNKFVPTFNKYSKIYLDCVYKDEYRTSKKGIDIYPYSVRCSLDIVCESSMGAEINAQSNSISDIVTKSFRASEMLLLRFKSILRYDFIWNISPQKREQEYNCKCINEYNSKILEKRREYLKTVEDPENYQMALIDLLIAESDKNKDYFKQLDILNNMSTFIVAGTDTIATNVSFTLFLLAAHPEIQEKVVEELVDVFGDSGREPDVNDLSNLKLLERCIKETLRLFPSASLIEKKLAHDETFGEYEVPAGCDVVLNIQAIHRDPKYYDEPDKFDPDRFLPENIIGRNPYAFIPFSAGPRNCIGQKYALMEGKVMLSTFLRRYKVESVMTVRELTKQIPFEMVLRPECGIPMRVLDRISHPELKVTYE